MARSGVEVLSILERPEIAGELAIIEGRERLDEASSVRAGGAIAVGAHFGTLP